ncbi:hypothetical protein BH11MYX3_BH11MYX3_35610 [soil metagenome]
MPVARWTAVLTVLVACGGSQPAQTPPPPKVDTAALAAELDAEQGELAEILHRDRDHCPELAANLKVLFDRMRASFARANQVQQDPALAKQLTTDLKRYDAVAAERSAQMTGDLTPDSPCVRDPAVVDMLMSMPTL